MLPLASCINLLKPGRDFATYKPSPAPNYAMADSWAALPERRDYADLVPRKSTLRDQQATAEADVFFLHRTTFINRKSWNAKFSHRIDRSSIRHQATVFNAAGRIYAPRYRQATLYAFFDRETPNGKQAIALAYEDVKAAFQYYLKHYNQGRPIILAGHSQGTVHAKRLLHEFFENDPKLRRQLVAAYLVGFPVKVKEYTTIRPCADSLETGCFLSWNSVSRGHEYPEDAGVTSPLIVAKSAVTNPLTWTTDSLRAPASLNRGGVGWPFRKINPQVTDAQEHNGLLWVTPPGKPAYVRYILPGKPEFRHSFHLADYGLFYMNVRLNAKARVQAWLSANK
ncbi:DUF3089 domain-containing protein [Hymenobacter saemangeumensis]|uniref:DUF3089 domain-containing protein n=1 Tax=Hymenobacter saemangeumensis TaxID=1084522 RepID=A0ABP8IR36_9BACT